MEELKNLVAWLEKVPVAMALMELKSASTLFASKLVRSVRKDRAAPTMAGSDPPDPEAPAQSTAKTSVPIRPSTASAPIAMTSPRRGLGERLGAGRAVP